ncbi:putative L-type lectin-domain containing receptor kinase S.5 [Panicum miliaceum]|uniref:L-type lectin-domain containing receptor kinase S.5 n=1 Tax=Panicum miliaceum TaxID=4540 RepID=A0A3L6ST84_PANMI|nr:putative L-type lectin-domain containing receptor kinase S.5 [Panicum miliaceum]
MEFDTRKSSADDLDSNHVGTDVNSIRSVFTYPLSSVSVVLSSGSDVRVVIQYDGTFLSIGAHLLEDISVGFAASTGELTQLNQIKSWSFSTATGGDKRVKKKKVGLLFAFLILEAYLNLEEMINAHGPVRFKLRELRSATDNFSPDRKLGRGGFGTVYLGYLHRMDMEVAVKRVSTSAAGSSNRGEKEFVAEIDAVLKEVKNLIVGQLKLTMTVDDLHKHSIDAEKISADLAAELRVSHRTSKRWKHSPYLLQRMLHHARKRSGPVATTTPHMTRVLLWGHRTPRTP